LVSVTSNPKKSNSKKCFENQRRKIILLFSLIVVFGTSFFSVQSNNHQALAQDISTPQIQELGTRSAFKSSNEVAHLATNHNNVIVDPSYTTVLSSYVVQFGSNQNPNNRTTDNATVNSNDPISQFGSNQNPNNRTTDNATVNSNDPISQFGSNMLR
jgi:hypothetical protein